MSSFLGSIVPPIVQRKGLSFEMRTSTTPVSVMLPEMPSDGDEATDVSPSVCSSEKENGSGFIKRDPDAPCDEIVTTKDEGSAAFS